MVIAKSKDVRNNFKNYCNHAADGEVYIIPRPKNRNVVILSEESYNKLSEMAERQRKSDYLDMLHKSIKGIQDGGIVITSINELEQYE